jgi:flagellar biosynthesis anti-sigma factor FlgM
VIWAKNALFLGKESTVKIKPKSLESQADLIQLDRSDRATKAEADKQAQVRKSLTEKSDQIQLSALAGALGELNPQQMIQDRQSKINSIKEAIKNGTYNPSSESVAQALAQEISIEILSAGGLLGQEN